MLADNSSSYAAEMSIANGSYNFFFEDPRFISILKSKGQNHSKSLEEALRVLEGWRTKYNISYVRECDKSAYCSGDLRDFILGYNSIHGYVSLLVSHLFSLL